MDLADELREEEASLKRLRLAQAELQRRVKLVERRIDALRLLTESNRSDIEFDLSSITSGQISMMQVKAPAGVDASEKFEVGDRRFGAMLTDFARERIMTGGPQTIQKLIDALPAMVRDEISARGETQPLDFRIRRVFRRSQDFSVDRKSGRVTYVGGLHEGEVPIITRLVVGPDAMESVVVDFAGIDSVIPIEQFSDEVRAGRIFGVRGPDRISSVVFVDGFYRSVYLGQNNDDMRNVPRERREKAART